MMSKIIDKMNNSNAKVRASVANVKGSKDVKELSVIRMGANSLYAVCELDDSKEILKAAKAINIKGGKLPVSLLDYGAKDEDDRESIVEMDIKGGISVTQEGTSKGLEALKAYSKEVYDNLKDFLK